MDTDRFISAVDTLLFNIPKERLVELPIYDITISLNDRPSGIYLHRSDIIVVVRVCTGKRLPVCILYMAGASVVYTYVLTNTGWVIGSLESVMEWYVYRELNHIRDWLIPSGF